MGLEDLETLERIFSGSNHLATVTRYATAYRRRLLINEYFKDWDEEKYANLSQFIYDNFWQADAVIQDNSGPLRQSMDSLKITDNDLKVWYKEEHEYFESLGKETPWDVHAMAYVEALETLDAASARLDTVSNQFLSSVPEDYQFNLENAYASQTSTTRRLETSRQSLRDDYNAALTEVRTIELAMGITRRWERTDEAYIATAKYLAHRAYHRALNNLQRLVVQRLFELRKLNLQKTGEGSNCRYWRCADCMMSVYRVRTHISKALQSRSKAIQAAVKIYNAAALALNPPRPTVDWSKVSHYSFLDEFALLHDEHNDVRSKPWSTSLAREVMRKARRIEHAQEQLVRSRVEALRLYTWIVDEETFFKALLLTLQHDNSPILSAVTDYCQRHRRVNACHLIRLQQLSNLPSFCTDLKRGQCSGERAFPPHDFSQVGGLDRNVVADADDYVQLDDEEQEGDIGGLIEYMSR